MDDEIDLVWYDIEDLLCVASLDVSLCLFKALTALYCPLYWSRWL